MGVRLGSMRQLLQGGEGLLVGEREEAFVRLDTVEVEGHDAIEKGLIFREEAGILRRIVQTLPDRFRDLCHVSLFSLSSCCPSSRVYDTREK